MAETGQKKLRTGWTTGACATAAAKAAYAALLSGEFLDPVSITLPRGEAPSFALLFENMEEGAATAAIIKDAGDDPDVTHGARIQAKVAPNPSVDGVRFLAGSGVGIVTKPGLPIPVGEPAINPVPRKMMMSELQMLADTHGVPLALDVEISIQNGEELAQKTMNPRLGIVGGLSVLGTTGIVRPFSCAAWIASIHRGVDVARATGLTHVAAATGATSEDVLRAYYPDLTEQAYIDMGDFAGGLLKYLRAHPVPKLTISGGIAKLTKLAQGAMDLHSARSAVDFPALADVLQQAGASDQLQRETKEASLVSYVAERAAAENLQIGEVIAQGAKRAAINILRGAPVSVEIMVTDRQGQILAHVPADEPAELEQP